MDRSVYVRAPRVTAVHTADRCPRCGGELAFREGCAVCIDCGWTRC